MGKLAKHILAFSNSGRGVVVYGVKELNNGSLESTGLEEIKDEAQFGSQIETYIPDSAHTLYALETYKYDDVYDNEIADKTFR